MKNLFLSISLIVVFGFWNNTYAAVLIDPSNLMEKIDEKIGEENFEDFFKCGSEIEKDLLACAKNECHFEKKYLVRIENCTPDLIHLNTYNVSGSGEIVFTDGLTIARTNYEDLKRNLLRIRLGNLAFENGNQGFAEIRETQPVEFKKDDGTLIRATRVLVLMKERATATTGIPLAFTVRSSKSALDVILEESYFGYLLRTKARH